MLDRTPSRHPCGCESPFRALKGRNSSRDRTFDERITGLQAT
jgi:hypothetical protein